MKNIILFLAFLIYATAIFFLPNNLIILLILFINISIMLFVKAPISEILRGLLKFLPFVLLTFVINILLGYYENAFWVAIKLILVCHITFVYAKTTSVTSIAKTIKTLCTPLKLFHIDTSQIEILVCISLSMIPIMKNELLQIKEACIAKSIHMNLKNIKIILTKLIISFMKRIDEIDKSLIEKGYNF